MRARRVPVAAMRRVVLVLVCAASVGWAGLAVLRRPDLPPAERGRRIAERTGCFGCHGPGGLRGANNPGRTDRTVPNFEGDVMMYAETPGEVREWIRDGVTRKKAASATWRSDRDRGALVMPAYGRHLGPRDIADLVACVLAASGTPEPDDSLAARGLERADALGCTGCHGPCGRFARPNPGSWKGCVPSWDSADFAELVRDSTEFREWVEHGTSRRFHANPLARFFLERAAFRMPAFRTQLESGDVPALWRYVTWLRAQPRPER